MDRIRNFIKTISYGERNRRQVIRYKEKVKKYMEMDTDEFDMNYIATISSYEHKKIVLAATAGISLAFAVSGIWRDMFYVIKQYFFLIIPSLISGRAANTLPDICTEKSA